MPQIGNLGVRIEWQFVLIDDEGNTRPLPGQPLHLQEPSAEAFHAAWQHFEAEREKHKAELAKAMQEAQGAPGAPPRAERRRAARAAVREATAATAPVNGKRADTAEKPVAASVEE